MKKLTRSEFLKMARESGFKKVKILYFGETEIVFQHAPFTGNLMHTRHRLVAKRVVG